MTTYNNVLDVFSYAAYTLANTLWSERALNHPDVGTSYLSEMLLLYGAKTNETLL